MNKKLVSVMILLLFTVFGLVISSLLGPKLNAPVFIKSLIYSEDMDIDLNYIAPKDFNNSVEEIQIPNAPKGIDCVVYGQEIESKGKYTVGTVQMGVNCDAWNEETGIGKDLEINELLISWSDGSQTTEEVGRITVIGGNQQCNNRMQLTGHDGIRKAAYTLTRDAEITGLNFAYPDEVFRMISNITINDVPLEQVSKDNPIKLKKNEMCVVAYQENDENKDQDKAEGKFPYGNVSVRCFLMGKSGENEEQIACFYFNKRLKDPRDYLDSSL